MRVLGIETSGELGSVAVTDGEALLCEIQFTATMKHSEKLFPEIANALKLAQLDQRDVELIGIATGPGSFTGLRIGVSSAKGLAQALNVPIAGVPSAGGFRSRLGSELRRVWVLIPDRMAWVYATLYEGSQVIAETAAWDLDTFIHQVAVENGKASKTPALLVGPGADLHRARFESEGLSVADEIYNCPSGFEIAKLALGKLKQEGADELFEIEPIYLYPPVATSGAKA